MSAVASCTFRRTPSWPIFRLIPSTILTFVVSFGKSLFPSLLFLFTAIFLNVLGTVPVFDGALRGRFVVEVLVTFSFLFLLICYVSLTTMLS